MQKKGPEYTGGSPADLDEAFRVFEARTNLEKGIPPGNPNRVYRLDRMKTLCAAFGNPQDSIPSIHLAGSKGKGSTAAYVAALAESTGMKVGVYASPHLVNYRERFRIENEIFPEETALETARFLLDNLPENESGLPGESEATTFELLTLFAFLLFRNTGCDIMVLETGLGGRLDATNVVAQPETVIITPIEKEHTEVLGKKLSQIAAEKAGVFKTGVPVWSAPQKSVVKRVLRKMAKNAGCELFFLDNYLDRIKRKDKSGSAEQSRRFEWSIIWRHRDRDTITLSMGSPVQASNAALALCALRNLEDARVGGSSTRRWPVIRSENLENAVLPGRFQFLQDNPPVVIDGAHTVRSIEALLDGFVPIAGENPVLIFGSVSGKDHTGMARILVGGHRPVFKEVIISTPGTFKPSDPVEIAESFRLIGKRNAVRVRLIADPEEAWRAANESVAENRALLVTGSFFMAGEIASLVSPEKRRYDALHARSTE